MDPGDFTATPSFSSGGFRNTGPQYSAYNTLTMDHTTQPPSISSAGYFPTSATQIPTDSQRTLTGETHVQPPSYTDFQHGGGNSITGDQHGQYRGFDPTDYGGEAPNVDDVVRENKSATGFNDFSGYEQPPSYSGVAPRDLSNPGAAVAAPATFDAGFSIVGRNFPRGNVLGPLY